MTNIGVKKRGLLIAGLAALVLGGTALTAATPAQAQYGPGYEYRGPVERRVIERRVVRPYGGPVYRPGFYGRGCRVVVTRRINRFGERVIERRRICR